MITRKRKLVWLGVTMVVLSMSWAVRSLIHDHAAAAYYTGVIERHSEAVARTEKMAKLVEELKACHADADLTRLRKACLLLLIEEQHDFNYMRQMVLAAIPLVSPWHRDIRERFEQEAMDFGYIARMSYATQLLVKLHADQHGDGETLGTSLERLRGD